MKYKVVQCINTVCYNLYSACRDEAAGNINRPDINSSSDVDVESAGSPARVSKKN